MPVYGRELLMMGRKTARNMQSCNTNKNRNSVRLLVLFTRNHWQYFVTRFSPLLWRWRQQVPANPSDLSSELQSVTVTSQNMQTFIVTAQQIAAYFVQYYSSRCLPIMQTWDNPHEQGNGNIKGNQLFKTNKDVMISNLYVRILYSVAVLKKLYWPFWPKTAYFLCFFIFWCRSNTARTWCFISEQILSSFKLCPLVQTV
jgi:hypothetical protein